MLEKEKVKMRKPSVVEGQAAVDLALLKAAEGLTMIERMVTQNVYEDVLEGKCPFAIECNMNHLVLTDF